MSYTRIYNAMYDPGYLEIPTPAQVQARIDKVKDGEERQKEQHKKTRPIALAKLSAIVNAWRVTNVMPMREAQNLELDEGDYASVSVTPETSPRVPPNGSPNGSPKKIPG